MTPDKYVHSSGWSAEGSSAAFIIQQLNFNWSKTKKQKNKTLLNKTPTRILQCCSSTESQKKKKETEDIGACGSAVTVSSIIEKCWGETRLSCEELLRVQIHSLCVSQTSASSFPFRKCNCRRLSKENEARESSPLSIASFGFIISLCRGSSLPPSPAGSPSSSPPSRMRQVHSVLY